jgi:putative tryptophan/tyrosine transport system substrate-binding protein
MRARGLMVVLMLGLLAAPPVTAQTPGTVFRIGILGNVPLSDAEGARLWAAFTDGLRELGYREGQNIVIEHRSSEGHYERLPALAAELVRLNVQVIVAPTAHNALAAEAASRTIPIVVASLGDPVGTGLVASLARPGGNVTGLSLLGPEISGKQIELLKEILPHVTRVAVLANPANPIHPVAVREIKLAARSLGIRIQALEARGPEALEPAFAAMSREPAGALVLPADGMFLVHRARIAQLATRRRLPIMYGLREHVDAGGLLFYGPSLRESFRRAASYVDRILRGARPADLPVEQATRFELVLNVRTATALGLTFPPSVMARADEVLH